MDLSGQRESSNVQDARGGKKGMLVGGGVVGLLVTLVLAYFGVNGQLAQQAGQMADQGGVQDGKGVEDGYKSFSAKILGSTEDVWEARFQAEGYGKYRPVKMKLFSEGVETGGCGFAPSAVGPFYCPASDDRRGMVYLDPTFFEELERKLGGSKAEFSQAYVIAHEVGHHVQRLLRYSERIEGYSGEGKNAGIRLELQADYLAGVWAHHARRDLKISEADVREAIKSAQSIGDNRIAKKSGGWVSPEQFTHGTDEQRTRWFLEGLKSGDASERAMMRFFDKRTPPLKL